MVRKTTLVSNKGHVDRKCLLMKKVNLKKFFNRLRDMNLNEIKNQGLLYKPECSKYGLDDKTILLIILCFNSY